MPNKFISDADYYLVKGWYENSRGLYEGVFYGACCLPNNPLKPIRVAIYGDDAKLASEKAASQMVRIMASDLMESAETDGDYWYKEDGKWVCRPGKKGDGGKLYNPDEPKKFQGLEIFIENPAGSTRTGVSNSGKKWETHMKNDYGFLKKVDGADGEGVDVYLGADDGVEFAYVVHQNNPKTGEFDEDKVMLGFSSAEEARKAYLDHYDDEKFFGSMTTIPMETFKKAVNSKGDEFKWKSKKPQIGVKTEDVCGTGAIAMGGGVNFVEPEVLMTRNEKLKRRKKPKLPHDNKIGPRIPTISQTGGRLGGNQQ